MGQYEKALSYSHSSEGSATEGPECIFTALMAHLLQAPTSTRICSLRKQIKLLLFLFILPFFLKDSFPSMHVTADAQMKTA